jgi:hypothetical protein
MHSDFPESPFGLLLASFTQQRIELSSLGGGFNLLVPALPLFFLQPLEKVGEFLPGKSLALSLEHIDLGHRVSLISRVVRARSSGETPWWTPRLNHRRMATLVL